MKTYSCFHTAILDNDSALITPLIKPHPHLTQKQQFAIYSEGYRIRLIQSIRSDYPILLKLLGDKLFDEQTLSYIENMPPASYNLDYYPHRFADFISKNYTDKFAGELATLEASIAKIFMLPDSEGFSANSFSKISSENFGDMIFNLRIACSLLEFSYPVNDWLTSARAMPNLPEIPAENKNFLVVVRHNNEVYRHNLNEPEFIILQNLAIGKNISEALEATINNYPEHSETITNNLQKWFINWIKNGLLTELP